MPQILDDAALAIVRDSLICNYFTNRDYLMSEEGQRDLITHLTFRSENNRDRVIPWLERFLSLRRAQVLQIGCGTGSSTLALVERGVHVTAVDILASSIQVAADRCRAFGHDAHFLVANAAELTSVVPNQTFDIVN
jgi:2-polyprenyl-3-methyl-5-hydroxy-6-metoxy-1,4-benzoquinol methylase